MTAGRSGRGTHSWLSWRYCRDFQPMFYIISVSLLVFLLESQYSLIVKFLGNH